MKTITVTLNYLGIPITSEFLDILQSKEDVCKDARYIILEIFFEISPKHLKREVLERYIEITDKTYMPVLPATNKIIERLLSPYKSAKRCYCLGEYIATIELCAHVGEMLAILLWHIAHLHQNTAALEKMMWDREFEELPQNRRTKILKSLGVIQAETAQIFDFLRTTRTDYFHIWSADVSKAKEDALECFLKTAQLIKEVLNISINEDKPSTFVINNPLLLEYLNKNTCSNLFTPPTEP